MNERLGTDIDDSIEKTEINETRNNIDDYGNYNEIRTSYTPTAPTTASNAGTPNQADETITDEDERAIATTTVTDEHETTKTNDASTSRPRKTKTTQRHLQDYIL